MSQKEGRREHGGESEGFPVTACILPVIFMFGFYHTDIFLQKIVSCTSLSAVRVHHWYNGVADLMEKLCSPYFL